MSTAIIVNNKTKGLRVRTSGQVFRNVNGNYVMRQHVYGRIDRDRPNVVLAREDRQVRYKEDFCNLPNRVKREIVEEFYNRGEDNRRVLYLVKPAFDNEGSRRRNRRNGQNNNRNNNR